MKDLFFSAQPKKGQEEYFKALQEKQIVFVSGRAGCGKTFLAISEAVKHLLNPKSNIEKICIIRPYIMSKSGEKLGALPGTLDEKIQPFIESIRDNLEELVHDRGEINKIIDTKIEALTLSTLRGRSLHNAFIIVEEAQNVPIIGEGMLTILTRLGRSSKIVIAGDPTQCDLSDSDSGFLEAMDILQDLNEVAIIKLPNDCVTYRNPIIGKIIDRFEKFREFNGNNLI